MFVSRAGRGSRQVAPANRSGGATYYNKTNKHRSGRDAIRLAAVIAQDDSRYTVNCHTFLYTKLYTFKSIRLNKKLVKNMY